MEFTKTKTRAEIIVAWKQEKSGLIIPIQKPKQKDN